jgi:hypothetical protein
MAGRDLKSESSTEPQSHREKFIAAKSTKNTKERIARAARVIFRDRFVLFAV